MADAEKFQGTRISVNISTRVVDSKLIAGAKRPVRRIRQFFLTGSVTWAAGIIILPLIAHMLGWE